MRFVGSVSGLCVELLSDFTGKGKPAYSNYNLDLMFHLRKILLTRPYQIIPVVEA